MSEIVALAENRWQALTIDQVKGTAEPIFFGGFTPLS
jgi:hypothetical protein